MASATQWTWVWVDSGSWWWTGRPGMLQFMGLQRVRHDWATELNWNEHLLSITLSGLWLVSQVSAKDCKKKWNVLLLFSYYVTCDSFATLWNLACQVSVSMGFPKQEYCRGLPFPSPRNLLNPGTESISPSLAGRLFTTDPSRKSKKWNREVYYSQILEVHGLKEPHRKSRQCVRRVLAAGPRCTHLLGSLAECFAASWERVNWLIQIPPKCVCVCVYVSSGKVSLRSSQGQGVGW